MVTIHDVRSLALTLPRTTEAFVRGRVKFRVGRIVYLAFSRDETLLGFAFPKEWRDALVETEPAKFMLPRESDLRYNWVVVRLAAIDAAEMRELVVDAWAMVVPKRVSAAYARANPEPADWESLTTLRPMAVSPDEARALALALPEAVEQDHHGRPSFRVGGRIFATLWSEQRMNVMLDEGGILTAVESAPEVCEKVWWGKRLAAVGVTLARADRELLSELLSDAWEQKAPKRLVGGR